MIIQDWGLWEGKRVQHIALQSSELKLGLLNYGARIQNLETRDRQGNFAPIVLGFSSFPPYLNSNAYHGAIVGRYANRIADSRIEIDGNLFQLSSNEGQNCLHGGKMGFDRAMWQIASASENEIIFAHHSPDGDQGFPGHLEIRASYRIEEENDLRLSLEAKCDAKTYINLTNHAYFNLAAKGNIENHHLTIAAQEFLTIHSSLIPLEKRSVSRSPFDFRQAKVIGLDLAKKEPQLDLASGFDHFFIVNGERGDLRKAAEMSEPSSGRKIEVWTSEAGVQFYTGQWLQENVVGHQGQIYTRYAGLCLEAQNFPNAPNRPDFPSAELSPGDIYRHEILYRFRS